MKIFIINVVYGLKDIRKKMKIFKINVVYGLGKEMRNVFNKCHSYQFQPIYQFHENYVEN